MNKTYQNRYKNQLKTLFLSCLALPFLQACTTMPEQLSAPETVTQGLPYLGVAFDPNDSGAGLKISRVLPGPMRQALNKNLDINIEHDRLVRVDDKPVSAATFKQLISEYQAGKTVALLFQRGDTSSTENEFVSLNVTLGNESDWTGPISKADQIDPFDRSFEYLPILSEKNEIVGFISNKVKTAGLEEATDDLYALFFDWQKNNNGFHSLSRVMFPFQQPENLLELETTVTKPLSDLHKQPEKVFEEIAANLDLSTPINTACNSSSIQWSTLLDSTSTSNKLLNKSFAKINNKDISKIDDGFVYLLSELSSLRTPSVQLTPEKSLLAMNASMQVDFNALLNSAATFKCFLDRELTINLPATDTPDNIPYEVKNAITGKIHDLVKVDNRWIVYGGDEDNSYDMSVIDVVYDLAGNDTYHYSKPVPISVKLVIDKSGNDKYLSNNIGPASGWLGTSLLIDHQGNDQYQGDIAANGTGILGIGILIDYAGKDVFSGNHFSNGAAYYGAGIILDLGNEGDVYHSSTFSQGFGGPRGFGLIYDYHGNDLYRANGPTPSVYGTDAVYVSFSQGIGFGLRHYDSGGIGIIYDAHGSDRYEGGEFSQAGGYYWGLGIIHDADGNDHYYGNRYSQGFGVHQATGILVDKKGNDNYWGMTAACQGAAWDVAMGLLIDFEGNDSYRGDGLCQGSAAMQAMGWLLDLEGTDHYSANSSSTQGNSGNNTYHYNPETPVYSWSLLLDAGGNEDFFSNDRGNNKIIRYSDGNPKEAGESLIHGLFIDHDGKLY